MIDYVAFGVIILDDIIMPDGVSHMGILGGGGPQAAWGMAAALGDGSRVGLVASAGPDLPADALAPLRAAGINLDGVQMNDLPTARAWQVMEVDGRRTQVWRVPDTVLERQLRRGLDMLPSGYSHGRGFHWGIHPGSDDLSLAQTLRRSGKSVSLETYTHAEHHVSEARLREMMSSASVFSTNWLEASRLTNTEEYRLVLSTLRDAGCQIFALRWGADGSDLWDLRVGDGVRVPAVPTTVVDTVGAGNAYCGALLARLAEGLTEAAAHASAAASYMVEQVGLPSQPPDRLSYERRLTYARERAEPLRMERL